MAGRRVEQDKWFNASTCNRDTFAERAAHVGMRVLASSTSTIARLANWACSKGVSCRDELSASPSGSSSCGFSACAPSELFVCIEQMFKNDAAKDGSARKRASHQSCEHTDHKAEKASFEASEIKCTDLRISRIVLASLYRLNISIYSLVFWYTLRGGRRQMIMRQVSFTPRRLLWQTSAGQGYEAMPVER